MKKISLFLLATLAACQTIDDSSTEQGLFADEQYCNAPGPSNECYHALAYPTQMNPYPNGEQERCGIICGTGPLPANHTTLEANRYNRTNCGLYEVSRNVTVGRCVKPTW